MKYTKMRYAAVGSLVLAFALSGSMAHAQTTSSNPNSTTTTTTTTTNTGTTNTNAGTSIYITGTSPYFVNILEGRNMTVGSRGEDVAVLQGLLSELGHLSVPQGIPLGYFGGLTRSAVARYQATINVPNTGYFGPMTRAAMRSQFGSLGYLKVLYPGVY